MLALICSRFLALSVGWFVGWCGLVRLVGSAIAWLVLSNGCACVRLLGGWLVGALAG